MIIERDLSPFCIQSEDSIRYALAKLERNERRIALVLSESGILEGILTDGDFRRWCLARPSIDLDAPARFAMNASFISAPDDTPIERLSAQISDAVQFIPLIDNRGRLTAIARPRKTKERLAIGSHLIADDRPAFIIAEIGNHHNGSLDAAKRLADAAKDAGADCAKFQMRHLDTLYRNSGDKRHDGEDLGTQYVIDILERFQLSNTELFAAFDYCKSIGILPLCTPWDQQSLAALQDYGLPAYKVASADLPNHDLLQSLCSTGKPLLCSTGMATEKEIVEAVALLKQRGATFALLHCNSTYPAPFKDINLRYLSRLAEISGMPVGYSGHERGIAVSIAAIAAGARIIERHITLDKTQEGNDHKVSLLPSEFKSLVEGIRQAQQALGSDTPRTPSQGELINRETLGKSVVAARPIPPGHTIEAADLAVKSPGRGLAPYFKNQLLGRPAGRAFSTGDFFFASDLEKPLGNSRTFRFNRPWGIPARYHDFQDLLENSNADLVEFHLSYKDLDANLDDIFGNRRYPQNLVVHAPELFAGDHVLDLCSIDPAYRERSLIEMRRVISVANRLKLHFPNTERPLIIVNVGGFTLDRPLSTQESTIRSDALKLSLDVLEEDSVELIAQTMPPYPWHFGGQRHHNLFLDPSWIAAFCKERKARICFDLSHSALWCKHTARSISEFAEIVAPYTAHLHVADAAGLDGEGLQIGEGEIDFRSIWKILDARCAHASFIPEIWQGHKNHGEGFWIALERLHTKLHDLPQPNSAQ